MSLAEVSKRWGNNNRIRNKNLDLSLTYWTNLGATGFYLWGIVTGLIVGVVIGLTLGGN